MDVKGAKALSERLAESARNVDREKEGLFTPELRELLKKQIDAAVRERMKMPPGQGRTAVPGGYRTAPGKGNSDKLL